MKKIFPLFVFALLLCLSSRAAVTFTLITPPCDSNGVLQVSFPTSVPGPYTIYWAGGAGTYGYTITTASTGVASITNYNGAPTSVTIYGPGFTFVDSGSFAGALPFTFSFSPYTPICATSASRSVSVTGGTPPYTYSWYRTTDPSTIVGTTSTVTLPMGWYGVWIRDATGCLSGSAFTYRYDSFLSVPTFTYSVASTAAACTNGTATVTGLVGAVAPLTYLWSNGATTAGISGLTMGTYSVTVTDATGCSRGSMVGISQTPVITPSITVTHPTCVASDGAVIAFGSGGVPPYTYLWSNGATVQSQSGLSEGMYGVTVTDANGCIGTATSYLGATIPMTVTYTTTPSSCISPTGTATLIPASGTAPYSYSWHTTPVQTTATATGLNFGTHNFTVTDAMGCVRTGTVSVPPVNVITPHFSLTSAYCATPTGAIGVAPTGGTAPYTYLWSNGSTTAGLAGVIGGTTYHVRITDAVGCSTIQSRFLPLHSPLLLTQSTSPATCLFNADGIIHSVASSGTPPYTYSLGGSTGIATGLLTGHYWITASDALGCIRTNHVFLDYNHANTSCYCTIEGTIYHDVNGNCVQDLGEPGIHNIQVNCSGRGYTYTDEDGHYSFKVPSGTYTITETVLSYYPLSPCQSNSITVTATAATGCVIPVDFANIINPIHDMHVSSWDYTVAVVGNPFASISVISNDGTVAEPAMLSTYKPDGQLLAPTFIPGSYFSGAPYHYSSTSAFPVLNPGQSQLLFRNYNVPTTVPIGTVVEFKDSVVHAPPMTNWLIDYSPWNNVSYYTATVVAGYDPNFKEVRPQGVGANGIIQYSDSTLEYMVHFQNTGSWYAQNIVVLDTLDEDLDWTTMKPVYQSAKCEISLTQSGPYKIAKFDFRNINLPPQMWNDMRSHGMFTYTIKTKRGLPVGTQFHNAASIYFDYNPPIHTNRTVNTLVEVTGVAPIAAEKPASLNVYPNPATDGFNAVINSDAAGKGQLIVADITGKTMISKSLELIRGVQTISTSASQLAPGIYLVSLSHSGKTETAKLVIVK